MLFEKKPADFTPDLEIAACFILQGKETLHLKTANHKKLAGLWGAPAGKIEKNETPLEAVLREVNEETGIKLSADEVKPFKVVNVKWPELSFTYYIFYATVEKKPAIQLNQREHEDYFWGTKEQLLKLKLIPDEENCIKMFYEEIVEKLK